MNDYLDNLIAKSLGFAEVVAPRPMSLFESAPPDAGLLAPDQYSLERDGAPQRTPAGTEPVMDVAAPPASKDEPPQHPVQSVDRGASLSAPLLIPHQSADVGQRADRARTVAPVNQQKIEGDQPAPVPAPLRIVSHATTPAERQVPDAPEAGQFTSAQGRGASITPLSPSGAMLVAPASIRRADQEGGKASPDHAAVPATDSATPTIKITIGRVDVRAVTPDKESPRAREAERRNPALTLEEYLKRRSGGKL